MKIETLREELKKFYREGGFGSLSNGTLRDLASRLGIPLEEPEPSLEEPEPSLEERHPRPWKLEHGLWLDARGRLLGGPDWHGAMTDAYNREPLLLEIAEAANRVISCWLSSKPVSLKYNLECQALESKLHRLRLAEREEGS